LRVYPTKLYRSSHNKRICCYLYSSSPSCIVSHHPANERKNFESPPAHRADPLRPKSLRLSMKETYIRPTSPTTFSAIERVGAAPDGPHLKIFRAVIEQDIRLLSKAEDETEAKAEAERDNNEAEEDENEDADPRKCVDIGQHPIEYYIYEVCAQKYKRSVRYWIFFAE